MSYTHYIWCIDCKAALALGDSRSWMLIADHPLGENTRRELTKFLDQHRGHQLSFGNNYGLEAAIDFDVYPYEPIHPDREEPTAECDGRWDWWRDA